MFYKSKMMFANVERLKNLEEYTIRRVLYFLEGEDFTEFPEILTDSPEINEKVQKVMDDKGIIIENRNSTVRVAEGDYIVRDDCGNYFAYNPSEFDKMFEKYGYCPSEEE